MPVKWYIKLQKRDIHLGNSMPKINRKREKERDLKNSKTYCGKLT